MKAKDLDRQLNPSITPQVEKALENMNLTKKRQSSTKG